MTVGAGPARQQQLSGAIFAAEQQNLHHRRLLSAAAAFLIYLALSQVFFGHSTDWTGHYIGVATDPSLFVWFLNWWPYAITHGLNPLISHFVWAPAGDNLAWRTSVPVAALAALPVTLLGGPVLSYNLLMLLAPALSAGSAFLLARHLTRDWSAALVGGFFFGFSSYENGHVLAGHLNLTLTFAVPLMILLCVWRVQLGLGRRRFVPGMALLMLIELGLSTEILLTFLFFGTIVWAIFLIAAPVAEKPKLRRLAPDVVFAGLIALLLAAPFIYYIVIGLSSVPDAIFRPADYSTDLLNYLLPTELARIGWPGLAPIANGFAGSRLEQGAYLGPPLLLLMALYFLRKKSEATAKALCITLLVLIIASLGPVLQIGGHRHAILLPWRLAGFVPLLENALPCRFTLYVSLVAAIVVAGFLAGENCRAWRFVLAIIAAVFLIPDGAYFSWRAWSGPQFFTAKNVEEVMGVDRTALILPFTINGPEMAWQVQAGMRFKQASGYTGYVIKPEMAYPIVMQFLLSQVWSSFGSDLIAYCGSHHVDDILIGPGAPPAITAAITAMGWPQRVDHGVLVVNVPSGLAYYEIQGDYWPWGTTGNWMGRRITVTTHGMPAKLVLTGTNHGQQPLRMTQTGPSGQQIFTIGDHQVKAIQIPADTTLTLTAAQTFVPDRVIHNGDIRNLSVLVSIDK